MRKNFVNKFDEKQSNHLSELRNRKLLFSQQKTDKTGEDQIQEDCVSKIFTVN